MTAPRADRSQPSPSPVVYDRNAVLTAEQVALGLQVSVSSVERADYPCFYIGRMPRYIWGKVLDVCAERSK